MVRLPKALPRRGEAQPLDDPRQGHNLNVTVSDPPAHILRTVSTGTKYEPFAGAPENRYGEQLEETSLSKVDRTAQVIGYFLQNYAAAIDYLAHRAHVDLR
jgi:hypothetical protein